MFLERLQTLADRITGTQAISLIAKDGIPVETVPKDTTLDIELLAAELTSQIRDISQNHQELDVGDVQQLAISTESMTLMVRAVSPEYYLLVVLSSDQNHGRARFELRRAILAFEEDLA